MRQNKFITGRRVNKLSNFYPQKSININSLLDTQYRKQYLEQNSYAIQDSQINKYKQKNSLKLKIEDLISVKRAIKKYPPGFFSQRRHSSLLKTGKNIVYTAPKKNNRSFDKLTNRKQFLHNIQVYQKRAKFKKQIIKSKSNEINKFLKPKRKIKNKRENLNDFRLKQRLQTKVCLNHLKKLKKDHLNVIKSYLKMENLGVSKYDEQYKQKFNNLSKKCKNQKFFRHQGKRPKSLVERKEKVYEKKKELQVAKQGKEQDTAEFTFNLKGNKNQIITPSTRPVFTKRTKTPTKRVYSMRKKTPTTKPFQSQKSRDKKEKEKPRARKILTPTIVKRPKIKKIYKVARKFNKYKPIFSFKKDIEAFKKSFEQPKELEESQVQKIDPTQKDYLNKLVLRDLQRKKKREQIPSILLKALLKNKKFSAEYQKLNLRQLQFLKCLKTVQLKRRLSFKQELSNSLKKVTNLGFPQLEKYCKQQTDNFTVRLDWYNKMLTNAFETTVFFLQLITKKTLLKQLLEIVKDPIWSELVMEKLTFKLRYYSLALERFVRNTTVQGMKKIAENLELMVSKNQSDLQDTIIKCNRNGTNMKLKQSFIKIQNEELISQSNLQVKNYSQKFQESETDHNIELNNIRKIYRQQNVRLNRVLYQIQDKCWAGLKV